MTDHLITIRLPDALLDPIRAVADAADKTVEQIVVDQLKRVVGVSLPALPPDEEAELAAFQFLSDDTLRGIAREQMPATIQDRLQTLMDRNNFGTITADEHAELEQLVERSQRLTLRKAWAVGVLIERGYKITAEDMTADDA